MKLHTTIRSLGFGCFGEQLHLQLTTRWFRIKKEMPRRPKLLMHIDASIAKSTPNPAANRNSVTKSSRFYTGASRI